MRRYLPLQIFLVQLAFTLCAAAAAVVLVRQAFQRYDESWQREFSGLPNELPLQPLVNEVGGAFLRRLDDPVDERRELVAKRISDGIESLLKALPAIEDLVVVDSGFTIRYASDKEAVGQGFADRESRAFLSADRESRRLLRIGGRDVREVAYPLFDTAGEGGKEPARRIGTVVVRYRTDVDLAPYRTQVRVEPISWKNIVGGSLLALVVATVLGSVLVAALTAVPVRRLVRALDAFRERGYRGGLDARALGLPNDLAEAVRAINELGGRLETLDAQGREREALLATLSQSLEEGMVTLDSAGNPVEWNAAALRILGAPPDTGANPGAPAREERVREALARWAKALRDGVPGDRHRPEVMDLDAGDGMTVPVRVVRVPFEIRPGETGTLLLIRDLVTLGKVEAHLMEAGRFAVLAHLAGGLAHEIRNPLHAIGLNATVVEQYVGAPPSAGRHAAMTESLATIRAEARRLGDLLANYLGLLRSSPTWASVDLRELCRRVIQLVSFSALKSQVTLRLGADPDPPRVRGVPDRLQQALLNLVLNAIQAMPDGGEVLLSVRSDGRLVRLSVRDTGPGVPPELVSSLFEARVTTKPGGTGLGLPIVRMIAEAHGGEIRYDRASEPGRGAIFTLSLPAEGSSA